MAPRLQALVAGALTNVRNPRVDNDVISAGMVQDLAVSDDGIVSLTFVLSPDDPATLVREVRQALREVDGVSDVKVRIVEPRAPAAKTERPAAPAPQTNESLGTIIAVSSGKGGVGKSTIAANLAAALAAMGHRVGLMDADVYGPNAPRMFGVSDKPFVDQNRRIIPVEAHGVKLISLGLLVERDAPAIWRGPIITKIIQQFLGDVLWGQLDYFIVDLPPGTGDAQLSLAQTIKVDGAIIVTTPQEMAVGDALRGAKMFEKVGVPVLGIVENMAGFVCPHCGEATDIFHAGGGERLAGELGVDLLVRIPLQAGMTEQADLGRPVVIGAPDSPAGVALTALAGAVKEKAGSRRIRLPVITAE